jgi:hypothetical protein
MLDAPGAWSGRRRDIIVMAQYLGSPAINPTWSFKLCGDLLVGVPPGGFGGPGCRPDR